MLEAKDLTKRYEDGLLALDHVNLAVLGGEILCLLGANGAGKTTTINLFPDFIRPSGGQALVDGIEVAAEPLGAKQRLAYPAAGETRSSAIPPSLVREDAETVPNTGV